MRATATDPDICVDCYQLPVGDCMVCGRRRPCVSVAAGTPTCVHCVPRTTKRCAHCNQDRPPTARWAEGPVCDPCYVAALQRRGVCVDCGAERRLVSPPGPAAVRCCDCAGLPAMHTCSECGREDKLYERGRCDRCALARRTTQAMAGPDGHVPAALQGVHDTIVASASPRKSLNWLRKGAGAPILTDLARGSLALSHEALDTHRQPRAANHVRQMLVTHGVLAPRDEQLHALEQLNAATVAAVARPDDRKAVAAFATWRVLRRVRRRAGNNTTQRTAISHARNQVLGAVRFLDWLAERDLTIATCTQGDLEVWLATGPRSRYDVHHFLQWTSERKLSVKLTAPPVRSSPGEVLDAEARWAIIAKLLRDPGVDVADRVAGSFVLLYAQPLSRIAVMTVDAVTTTTTGLSVRFGAQAIAVPSPLSDHVTELVATGRAHHQGIGSTPSSPWLFPGHLPGRPITALRLGQRLAAFGIDARAGRRAAQTQLAAQVPAVVLAEMLGIAVATAVDWVHAAGGDWANYAALTTTNAEPT
ncbi:MAG: hypothetical protein WD649_04895 [Thermoleophilaceae bacterium]